MLEIVDRNDYGEEDADRCKVIGAKHYRNTIGTVEIQKQHFASGIESCTQNKVEDAAIRNMVVVLRRERGGRIIIFLILKAVNVQMVVVFRRERRH